jgi:hypothetical protein
VSGANFHFLIKASFRSHKNKTFEPFNDKKSSEFICSPKVLASELYKERVEGYISSEGDGLHAYFIDLDKRIHSCEA